MRRLSPVHKAIDGRKQNPRTRRHALSAGIYHSECVRGLVALEAARRRASARIKPLVTLLSHLFTQRAMTHIVGTCSRWPKSAICKEEERNFEYYCNKEMWSVNTETLNT